MNKQEMVELLKTDVDAWNEWRRKNPNVLIDLSGAGLSGADLSDVNLIGANLIGANLTRADLRGTNLSDANLTRADLRGANLTRVYLRDANLSGADLRGANLSGAYLSGADLRGAYLSKANLFNANLRDANLRRTRGIYTVFSLSLSSRQDTLMAFVDVVNGAIALRFDAGCQQSLTADELLIKVNETHGDNIHAKQYILAVQYIKSAFEVDINEGRWNYLLELDKEDAK